MRSAAASSSSQEQSLTRGRPDCSPAALYSGLVFGYCTYVYVWDSVNQGEITTTTNAESDVTYDACG